jgi:ribosomal protein L29
MKMNDIKKKSQDELKKLIFEKESEIREVRFGSAGAGTRNMHAPREARKVIARAKTTLTQMKEA